MPSSWVEPIFTYSLIYDFATYILLTTLFFILRLKKIINNPQLFLSSIFLLTPFLFNGFLFDWEALPDQSKYLGLSYEIRKNPNFMFHKEFNTYSDFKIFIPSALYAFSPIISLETYKGIALFNRALFLLTWIFFMKKKYLDEYNSIFFLIIPSLILYTSVALRDNLIILLMLWFIYFFYQKNFFLTFLASLGLLLIKYQMLIIIGLFLFFEQLLSKNKVNLKFFFLSILTILIFTYVFNFEILNIINKFRQGFFLEEFGYYRSVSAQNNYQYFKLDFSLSSIPIIMSSFFNFIIPSILKGNITYFNFILMCEVIVIYGYLYIRIKLQKNFNSYIFFKWLFVLIFSYFIYSLIIFNGGTIHRYKVPILFFVIFGYFANIKVKQIK